MSAWLSEREGASQAFQTVGHSGVVLPDKEWTWEEGHGSDRSEMLAVLGL